MGEFKTIDAKEHRSRGVSGYPQVSISTSRIYFNAAAVSSLGEHVNSVNVLFDEEGGRMGIQEAAEDDRSAFPLAKNNKYKGRNINSKSMIKGIMGEGYDKTQKYIAEWNEEERMLIVSIDSPL